MELFAGSELGGAQVQPTPLAAGAGIGADGAFFAFFAALPPAAPDDLSRVATAPASFQNTAAPVDVLSPEAGLAALEGPARRFAALTTDWPEVSAAADRPAASEAAASPETRPPATITRTKTSGRGDDALPDVAIVAPPTAAVPLPLQGSVPTVSAALDAAPSVAPQQAPEHQQTALPGAAAVIRAAPATAGPSSASSAFGLPPREMASLSGPELPSADSTRNSVAEWPAPSMPGSAVAEHDAIADTRSPATSPAVGNNGPATALASPPSVQETPRAAPPDDADQNRVLVGDAEVLGWKRLADAPDPLSTIDASNHPSSRYKIAANARPDGNFAPDTPRSAMQQIRPDTPVLAREPPLATPTHRASPALPHSVGPRAQAQSKQPAFDRAPAATAPLAGAGTAAFATTAPTQQGAATGEPVVRALDGARLPEPPLSGAGHGPTTGVQSSATPAAAPPPATSAKPEAVPRSPLVGAPATDAADTTRGRAAATRSLPRDLANETVSRPADVTAADAAPSPVSDPWQRPGQAGASHPPTVTAPPAHQSAEVAVSVVRQLVESAARTPDHPIELTLAPEELGRVRLTLASSDLGVSVSVHAERPETLDLIRRNIDHLARDFRELGYTNIAFNFGDRPQRGQPEAVLQQPEPEPAQPALRPVPDPARQPGWRATPESGGLDLRL